MQKVAIFGGFRVADFRRFLGDPGFSIFSLKAPLVTRNHFTPYSACKNPSKGRLGPISAAIFG
jgi:hypothetical protein